MPLMQQDITGVQTVQTAAPDQQGRLQQAMQTSFKVRGQGPFFITLPVQGWTAEAADKEVQRVASQIVSLCDKYPQG